MRSSVPPVLLLACWGHAVEAPATPPQSYPLWDGQETVEQYAWRADLPSTRTLDLGNGVKMELVLIPAGKFIMGTPRPTPVDEYGLQQKIQSCQAILAVAGTALLLLFGVLVVRAVRERHRLQYSLADLLTLTMVAGAAVMGGVGWWSSSRAIVDGEREYGLAIARYIRSSPEEQPAHQVTISRPFYMGKYEVTQEQFEQVLGTNPRWTAWCSYTNPPKGWGLPVVSVRDEFVEEFIQKVSAKAGTRVRLPSEAEWEYACRAGSRTTYYTGDADSDLDRAGWYEKNSKGQVHPVGEKEPNAWGLYDMLGNVDEMCRDSWHPNYVGAPSDGTPWRDERLGFLGRHVVRGGRWDLLARGCNCVYRRSWWFYGVHKGGGPYRGPGFRVIAEVKDPWPWRATQQRPAGKPLAQRSGKGYL